jgi:hypothetical protein
MSGVVASSCEITVGSLTFADREDVAGVAAHPAHATYIAVSSIVTRGERWMDMAASACTSESIRGSVTATSPYAILIFVRALVR